VDPTTAERDAEGLAALRRVRRTPVWAVLAAVAAALAIAQLARGYTGPGLVWTVAALLYGWTWWAGPRPRLIDVTTDGLVLRRGLRTSSVPRADVLDVQPEHDRGYGLELTLRNADPLRLTGTALRFSVAAEQAAALRRWAGLEEPDS